MKIPLAKYISVLAIISFLIVGIGGVIAQLPPNNTDVATKILELTDDRVKLDSIITYTSKHRKDSAVEFLFVEGLKIARKQKFRDLEARLLDSYGVFKRDFSDYSDALRLHKQALEIARSIDNKSIEMYALNNIGVVFRRLDQNNEALNYHLQALKIAENIKDGFSTSVSLNSIGNIHIALGNYRDAINYFARCLPIAINAGNNLGIAMNLNNVGEAYERLNQLDSAKKYYEASLNYNKKLTNEKDRKKGIAICYGSLGNVYKKTGDYDQAQKLYEAGLNINKELGDKIFISQSYNFLGGIYQLKGEYQKALQMFENGCEIAQQIRSKSEIKAAFEGLMNTERHLGNFENALKYSDLSNLYADSINIENNNRHIKQVEAIYQIESEQSKIKLLETTRTNDRIMMVGSLVLFALLLITAILYYVRNRLIERNKSLKRELEIRSQIASDLHDDMGSSLSSIHIFSELLRKPGAKSEELLTKIEENAKDTLEALDDIIWLVKPSNDKFSNLSMHVSQYAVPLFEGKGIKFEMDFADDISEAPLPMEARRNIFLIIKESVNNLVKYSGCTEAVVKAEHIEEGILFTIKDNGKGFNPEMLTDRNGLKNLRARANQINADIEIKSAPGQGTEIRLMVNSKDLVSTV